MNGISIHRCIFTCAVSFKKYEPLPKFHTPDQNFYTVLEIDQDASLSEIKKAYFSKSKDLHPDRNTDPNAVIEYRDVKDAYEVLSHAQKKEIYDDRLLVRENYAPHMRKNRFDDLMKGWKTDAFYKSQEQAKKDFESKMDPNDFRNLNFDLEDLDEKDLDGKKGKFEYSKEDLLHPENQEYKKFERIVLGYTERSNEEGIGTETRKDVFDIIRLKRFKVLLSVYLVTFAAAYFLFEDESEIEIKPKES